MKKGVVEMKGGDKELKRTWGEEGVSGKGEKRRRREGRRNTGDMMKEKLKKNIGVKERKHYSTGGKNRRHTERQKKKN